MSWPMVKLGDASNKIDYGLTASAVDKYDGLKFLRITDLQDDAVNWANVPSCECSPSEYENNRLEVGDIVFARTGATTGKSYLIRELGHRAVFASYLIRVRPGRDVDSIYLSHFFKSPKYWQQISSMANGAAQPGVNSSKLKELEVPLPPLSEQKRIAAILDKADAIRRKRQQAIQLADDFLRAVFLDMFGDPVTNPKGWEVKSLGAGITSIRAGWSAVGDNNPCTNGGLGVLKISSVTSGVFKPFENKSISTESIPQGKELIFPKKGDLLFSRANTRELVAATCIVFESRSDVFLPDKLWLIQVDKNKLMPEFLHCLIWHPLFKERLTSQATGSSGSMLNISKEKFENTLSIFPDIDAQRSFGRIYWGVQRSLNHIESSGVGLSDAFSSLSQKAFSGQL